MMANVVIIGANQGIGYYIVERLLLKGHSVTVLDIVTDQVANLAKHYPERCQAFIADAREEESIEEGVRQAVVRFGHIDAAIHNACMCIFGTLAQTSLEVYHEVLDVNMLGAVRLTKAVLPFMQKAGGGRIVFTSSGVGVTGFDGISPYAASKGAIEAFAKCMQIENDDTGVSFHLFHPPLTDTASASGLPIPKEFKADAKKVGYGLADHLWDKQFVICHSRMQALQMRVSYRHPLFIGRLMTKMTKRVKKEHV